MGASLKIKKYLLFLAVCLLLIGVGSVFGDSENGSVTYPFRIVQVSDTQPPPDNKIVWKRASEAVKVINSLKPNIVIFPGDITHSGTEDEYKRMKGILSKIQAPVYYVPGNHETLWPVDEAEKALSPDKLRDEKLKLYHKYFGPDHWFFEYADFLFVGFDCTENWPRLSRPTREWLTESLSSSDKPYKFVVTHYTHHQTQDTILEHLMTSENVVGYLHGHNHTIQAYKDTNTERLVFSSGSATLISPENDYGVMYFDVYKDSLVCFWKPVNGDVRPLGIFNLKEAKSTISRRKDIFEIAPYIQQLKPNEVTVKWQTKTTPDAAVVFKSHGKDKWDHEVLAEKSNLHEIKLCQLTPGTKYEFYVEVDTKEFGKVKSPTVLFKTPLEEKSK